MIEIRTGVAGGKGWLEMAKGTFWSDINAFYLIWGNVFTAEYNCPHS